MYRNLKTAFALGAFALLGTANAANAQFSFQTNFDGSTLDPNFTVVSSSGFAANVGTGKLVESKTSGIGNGSVNVVTNFAVNGDFIADTTTSLLNFVTGHNQGISAYAPVGNDLTNLSQPQFDVFFCSTTQICAGWPPTGYGTPGYSQPSQTVTFRLQRQGQTVSAFFNNGNGFVNLGSQTSPLLTAPVRLSLFLDQENGNTTFQQGSFQSLRITSPNNVPAPSSLLVALGAVPLVGVLRRRRK